MFRKLGEAMSRWNAGRPERKRRRREAYEARIASYEEAAEEHRGDLSYSSPYLRRHD